MDAEKQYQPLPYRSCPGNSQRIGFEIQDNRPPITQRYPILAVLHQSAPLQKKVAQFGLGNDLNFGTVIKLDIAGSGYRFWIKAAHPMGGRQPIPPANIAASYGIEQQGDQMVPEVGEDYVYRERNRANVTTYTLSGPLAIMGASDSGTYTIEKNVQMGIALIKSHISNLPERPIYVLIKGHSRGAVAASRIAKNIKELNVPNVLVLLTVFDPVPGPLHSGEDSAISTQTADAATLIVSLDPKRAIFNPLFGAQRVSGSQRVILTLEDHLCGLQEKTEAGNHKQGFTYNGRHYSAMQLSLLNIGLYGAKKDGTLQLLTTTPQVFQFINSKIAVSRLNVIESCIKPFIPDFHFYTSDESHLYHS